MVRFKNRYLLAELRWEDGRRPDTVTGYNLLNAIKDSLQYNFGDFGLGSNLQSLQVKYFNPTTNMCIVRCNRDHHNIVWAALSFIGVIAKHSVSIHVLHVGGTVKLCQKAAIAYDREVMLTSDRDDE